MPAWLYVSRKHNTIYHTLYAPNFPVLISGLSAWYMIHRRCISHFFYFSHHVCNITLFIHYCRVWDVYLQYKNALEYTMHVLSSVRTSNIDTLYILELRPILPAVTSLLPSITCIVACLSCSDTATYPSNQWQGSTRAPRERPQDFTRSLISRILTRHNLKKYKSKKYEKKSAIHDNADANITCNFRDSDISHLRVAYLTHAIHSI